MEDFIYQSSEMHPFDPPSVVWNALYALHSAQRHTESPVDAFDLAIQNVARYKREVDK